MTSPGGNIVEIRVVARDMAGPAFEAAARRAKALADKIGGGRGSVSDSMQEADKRASSFSATLRRVGEVAGGVLVAGVVQQMSQRALHLVRSTAEAASGLSESMNAVNKTFGEGTPAILKWGEANANALGMSQRAFNQSATVLGAMLKNQGLATSEVTAETTKLAERAADMASVFNTDVGDALAAIQAGLRGEIDPLERYGVSLSAAAVEQRALATSGKTAAKELTAQDKAMARLAVLYEQTADVAGDFRDTSDGMANAQRIATAQIEDAKAKIGTAFMPVLAKASTLTGTLAQAFASIPAPVQIATVVVIGLGAAIGLLGPKILATRAALATLPPAMRAVTSAAGPLAIGLAFLGAAMSQMSDDSESLHDWAKRMRLGDTLVKDLNSTAKSFEELDAEMAKMASEGEGERAMRALERSAAKMGLTVEEARATLPQFDQAMREAADATLKVANTADKAERSVDELEKEFDQLTDTAFGLEAAQDAAGEAIDRLKEQVKEEGAALTGNTQAARDNRESVRDLVDMYKDLMVETQKAGGSTDVLRQELEDQLVTMGFSREEVKRYTDMLFGLEQQLKKVDAVDASVHLGIGGSGRFMAHGGITGAAGGGPRGSRTMVGEQGPEIVDLPFGSTVHSNADSMRMASQATPAPSGPLEVIFGGDLDSAFATAFMKLMRTGQITILSHAVQG